MRLLRHGHDVSNMKYKSGFIQLFIESTLDVAACSRLPTELALLSVHGSGVCCCVVNDEKEVRLARAMGLVV